jgi:hypothetical protein
MRKLCLLFICFNCFVACTSKQKETEHKAPNTSQTAAVPEDEKTLGTENTITAEEAITPTQQIIPGKSIGLIKLNEDAEVVHKLLGKPTTSNSGMGKSLQTWTTKTADGKTQQISIFFSRNMGNADEKSRAKQIRIKDAAFKNKANYATTETTLRSNISEAKKTITYTLPGFEKEFTIFDNVKTGIAFEFDPTGNVVAITVHEPGKPAFEIFSEVGSELKKIKPSEQSTLPFHGIKD